MTGHGKISHVWNQSELEQIEKILRALPNQQNTGKFHAYTNGIDRDHFLYGWATEVFAKKIQQQLNTQFVICQVMYLDERIPWPVHTDWHKTDSQPHMAFLIPLGWDGPVQSRTHTVIFNQQCITDTKTFAMSAPVLAQNCRDLHTDLCQHVDPDLLSCLSLAGVYEWQPGALIYWNRDLLHCSDYFPAQGISSKQAAVVFTSWIS